MVHKKRFLILTNRVPYPLTDGGNLAMNAMIEGYHNAGKEVYLLSMNTFRHYVKAEDIKKIYRHISGFSTVDVDNSLGLLGILKNFIFSKEPNHAGRFYSKAFKVRLKEVIRDFDPEVIQVESVFLSTYIPFIKEISSAALVLRMHNIEYQVWGRLAENEQHTLKKIYLKDLAKRIKDFEEKAWRQYDLLLPITEVDAMVVKLLRNDNQFVVAHYGINTEDVRSLLKTEKWEGYHIGAMDWLPNWEAMKWFLEDVWPKLHKRIPDFKFSFAGREMPQHFKNLQLEGVACMGEVPDADTFIADKKILIVPLKAGGGIRVKIMEAMAFGKLVVSTTIGMQGLDAVSGIHYVQADDSESFIRAIEWILEHKEEAESIGKNGQELMRTLYGQKAIMRRVIEKIDGLRLSVK